MIHDLYKRHRYLIKQNSLWESHTTTTTF